MREQQRQFFSKVNRVLLLIALLIPGTTLLAQKATIAVLDFQGRGISQTEVAALSDRLRNELFRLDVFQVVERGMMETILIEQDFQLTGCISNECLVEVAHFPVPGGFANDNMQQQREMADHHNTIPSWP